MPLPAPDIHAEREADAALGQIRDLAASEAKRKEGDGPVPGQPWHPSADIGNLVAFAQEHNITDGAEAVRRYRAQQAAQKAKAEAAMPARVAYAKAAPGTRQPVDSRPSPGGTALDDWEYGAVQALAAREGLSPIAALAKYKASRPGR